jgi:hypothetical protein
MRGPDVPEGIWTIGKHVAGFVLGGQSSLLRMFLVYLPPRTESYYSRSSQQCILGIPSCES